MSVQEINSFVQKFHQLWNDGFSAHLDMDTHAGEAWVGLRVQLGHLHHHLQPSFSKDSPSRRRRRARREAELNSKTEEVLTKANTEKVEINPTTDKVVSDENIDAEEATSNQDFKRSEDSGHPDQSNENNTDSAEEATAVVPELPDELLPDKEFEIAPPLDEPKSICRIELFPTKYKLDGLISFRDTVEDYFKNRSDVIKRVIECKVVNYGSNVELLVEMKMKRGWIFFFCDPEENYSDLEGLRTVRHSCQDLSKCGG